MASTTFPAKVDLYIRILKPIPMVSVNGERLEQMNLVSDQGGSNRLER